MTRRRLALAVVLSIAAVRPAATQPSSAHDNAGVIQLQDTRNQTVVSIISSVGNIVFEMKVKGHEVLRWPYASIEDFKSRPRLSGIPFLGPWANRLDEQAFICFEPMAGITDAMNLAQKGLYHELQSIPAGGTWQESFWIRPRGF